MDLSIIIPTYNIAEVLDDCLNSIIKYSQDLSYEIIVVDNASSDNIDEIIAKYKDIKFIKNKKNLGFGKASNQGFRIAKGTYILFLNSDTRIHDNCFKKLIDKLEQDKTIGFIGPKMTNRDGSFQAACRRTIPTPFAAFCRMFGLSKMFPNNPLFNQYSLGNISIDKEMEIEAISGACLMSRKDILDKIGGFDEQYFIYGEDLDMCLQITKLGYKGYYYPKAEILHFHKATTKKRKYMFLFHFYYSAYLFFKKNYNSKFLLIFVMAGLIIRCSAAVLKELFFGLKKEGLKA
ncbi:MAG: glycosyltransferase family 2 protein [Bacteroidota bacterium]